MAEIRKYSIVEKLRKADEELQYSPALLGMTSLTYPNYINAMRSTMFTSHLKQFLNLLNPQYPYVFTNNENLVGKYSHGYKLANHDLVIYKKIKKYDDIIDSTVIGDVRNYLLFVYDKSTDSYDIIERKVCENLTENFGYEYNNEKIDSLNEGDEVPEGTVLYKSTSYDDDMNYSYGRNALVAYTLDPFTSEDAAVVSRSVCSKFSSIETEEIKISLNDNQYLLNLYGDKDNYLPLPPIGTKVSNILAVSRKKFNNQLLFDFKDSSLKEIHESDDIFWIDKNSEIIDYTIFNNSDKNYENSFYTEINKISKSQHRYYKKVVKTCEEIINSGKQYSQKLDYVYKRALDMIDEEKKWRDGDNEFSNLKIIVTYERHVPLAKGCKLTGRYGNKSVVSEIREDEDMPFTEDGRRVDVLLNLLAIINRTTSFLLFEMFINGSSYKIRQKMKELPTLAEKENMLFDYVQILSKKQYEEFYSDYKKLNKKGKEAYIQAAIDDGIYIHQMPMWEDKAIFYKCQELRVKFPFLQMDKLYLKKWGHTYPILSEYYIGEMYLMKLKQSDRRGFSARSTGALDSKSLPTRSFKSKVHMERTSSSCIRFGEFESLNFSIGIIPEDISLFHSLYRSSINGRKDLVNAMFADEGKGILNMKSAYTSRISEIFNVTLKSMGIELDFEDDENEIKILNKDNQTPHVLNGVTYLCSDYQFYILERISRIRAKILMENPIMTTQELNKAVDNVLKTTKFLNGEYKEDLKELELSVKAENDAIYAKLQEEKLKEESEEIAKTLESVSKEVDITSI